MKITKNKTIYRGKRMNEIEERIIQISRESQEIRKTLYTTIENINDDFYNYTSDGLESEISYMDKLLKILEEEGDKIKELKNKNKPLQAHKIVLRGDNFTMNPSDSKEYIYISTDSTQFLREVLADELEETWKELGTDKNIKEIIESDEFIKKLEENNIYYMNHKYMGFEESFIYCKDKYPQRIKHIYKY